ncbi:MAG: hypothetical protein V2A73_02365 [Pseudomonadota bacterium]
MGSKVKDVVALAGSGLLMCSLLAAGCDFRPRPGASLADGKLHASPPASSSAGAEPAKGCHVVLAIDGMT